MTTDPVPASAPARSERDRLDAASRERRRLKEAVLVRRARYEDGCSIAAALAIPFSAVTKILMDARQGGDQRALTEGQARAARAVAVARAQRESAASAPAPVLSAPPAPAGPQPLRRPLRPDAREFLGHLTRYAVTYGNSDAGSNFAHLADLYAHCEHYYPDLAIPSQDTTIEETRRRFPPARPAPLGACVLG